MTITKNNKWIYLGRPSFVVWLMFAIATAFIDFEYAHSWNYFESLKLASWTSSPLVLMSLLFDYHEYQFNKKWPTKT